MKKLTFILLCVFTVCVISLRADNDKPIQVNQLPAVAQQFIKQHFANRKVALAKVETEFLSKKYEVVFADGDHINFDSKGNWEEIECKSSSVPAVIVPAPIMDYIHENYPETTVKKIEKEHREYEVKLSNRVELSFDKKFNLVDLNL